MGRIGRTITRLLANESDIVIVAVNDFHKPEVIRHFLQYDSTHGTFPSKVQMNEDVLSIGEQEFKVFQDPGLNEISWGDLKVDVVLECTGKFKSHESASNHIRLGAGKVLLSAPPVDDYTSTVVLGVNDSGFDFTQQIISNASCTSNNAAPMMMLLDQICGIDSCYITTVHSYTGDQKLQDAPHEDWRRGRGAAQSIVPTTTGAAKALTRIFPDLKDVIGGCGISVPVPDGSLTDITCIVKEPKGIEYINQTFKDAADSSLKGVLQYTDDPIVSSDVIGNKHSCIFDSRLTSVINHMVKIVGWYDNEVGYSSRMLDVVRKMA